MTDRLDQIISAFEKIAELPDGEVKDALAKEISGQLTIKEATELALSINFSEDKDPSLIVQLAVVFTLYKALGIPLDIPTKDLSKELSKEIEEITPLIQELGSIVRQITKKMKPNE